MGCGDGEVVLNHAKVVGADGRGDIPPGWSVSVLWGSGLQARDTCSSIPPRTGLTPGWPFTKKYGLNSGLALFVFFALVWHPVYTDPGRFGWRCAEGVEEAEAEVEEVL